MAPGSATDVRARRHARTRSEILDAAWRRAEQHGLGNLSLRDLAQDVGMRAPSLYTYFPSKAAIFDAMFAEGYTQLDAVVASIRVDPQDLHATLTAAMVAYLDFCKASVPRYQLMFTRVVADWEPSPQAYAISVASYRRMASALATLGIAGERALDLWTALTAGLAAQQLANDPGGDRWVRLAADAADMFVHHVRRTR